MDITFNIGIGQILQFVVAVFLPVLVGLVTKSSTSASKKAILLLGLSVVTSLLTEILNAVQSGGVYDLGVGLLAALTTFVVGVSLHYGLWKPTGVSETVANAGVTGPSPRS